MSPRCFTHVTKLDSACARTHTSVGTAGPPVSARSPAGGKTALLTSAGQSAASSKLLLLLLGGVALGPDGAGVSARTPAEADADCPASVSRMTASARVSFQVAMVTRVG